MALATSSPGGRLKTLNNKCLISIPYGPDIHVVNLKITPEISDTKRASYSDTSIIGRSNPIKTYSHSENRVITMRLHFIVVEPSDITRHIFDLRAIESAVYPSEGTPYRPPPVCKIKCGRILGDTDLCVVLESYSLNVPTNVVWDKDTLLPYYFELNTTWHVVYAASGAQALPNQTRILNYGI